jgi:hypothetical protein
MIRISKKEILEELTAAELSYDQGIDGAAVDRKANDSIYSISPIKYDENSSIINFKAKSTSRPAFGHNTQFHMINLQDAKQEIENIIKKQNQEKNPDFVILDIENFKNIINRAILADIKLHCSCESYQYYRSYQLTQLDSAIYPETRPPKRNDPQLKRVHLCHHLLAVLRYVLKDINRMAEYIINNDGYLKAINRNLQYEK